MYDILESKTGFSWKLLKPTMLVFVVGFTTLKVLEFLKDDTVAPIYPPQDADDRVLDTDPVEEDESLHVNEAQDYTTRFYLYD